MSEVKRYSVWDDELFDEKHAINAKNGMVHLVVKFDDYAALEAKCAALLDEIKNMQDQAIDDGCRIAELEEALRDKQALIPDECDTTTRQFESLINHKHHFINGTCVECMESE